MASSNPLDRGSDFSGFLPPIAKTVQENLGGPPRLCVDFGYGNVGSTVQGGNCKNWNLYMCLIQCFFVLFFKMLELSQNFIVKLKETELTWKKVSELSSSGFLHTKSKTAFLHPSPYPCSQHPRDGLPGASATFIEAPLKLFDTPSLFPSPFFGFLIPTWLSHSPRPAHHGHIRETLAVGGDESSPSPAPARTSPRHPCCALVSTTRRRWWTWQRGWNEGGRD